MKVKFKDLKPSTWFELYDCLYVKTEKHGKYNAVGEDGIFEKINDEEEVRPLKITFIYKYL